MSPAPHVVDRDTAERLAREELSKPEYAEAEPSLIERLWRAFWEWVDGLLADLAPDVPGTFLVGLVLIVVAIAVIALVIYLRPARRVRGAGRTADIDAILSADQHRTRADQYANDGDYAEAVRERLRAVNRELEDQVIIPPRPGRTATELANEAAAALGSEARLLHDAAGVFNDIWYGGRPPTAERYQALVAADEALDRSQPAEPRRAHS